MSLSTANAADIPPVDSDDVLFHTTYGLRLIELNRPKKLNSLNGSMCQQIIPRLLVCSNLPSIAFPHPVKPSLI